MRIKSHLFFTIISISLLSCGGETKVSSKPVLPTTPCNIRVEISGQAEFVQFNLHSVANNKIVSIDREVDVLDNLKDEFSISSFLGGKFQASLKTKDSYGPEVKMSIYINNKLWKEAKGSYNPSIEGELPDKW